ncbi:piezo-type mechanosensitive ion channel homolog [Bidens hawaiensis]|uniref:piezo-type mechanosensitive ion channel homolog n=1 Tax=Bidens hawaiensis TaxID=980011 RepID=UPI004049281E
MRGGLFLLSLLLFTAAVLKCSLISLGNLLASLLVLFVFLETGCHSSGRALLWSIVTFSLLVILSQLTFLFAWAIWCGRCSLHEPLWAEFIGFMIVETWRSPTVIYVLILQLLAAFTAFTELHEIRLGLFTWAASFLRSFAAAIELIGWYRLTISCIYLTRHYLLQI